MDDGAGFGDEATRGRRALQLHEGGGEPLVAARDDRPRRVGLVSGRLEADGLPRLVGAVRSTLAAGAHALIVQVGDGPLGPDAARALVALHRRAAEHGASLTLVTSDPLLRDALAGLPVPGGARLAASAPVAMRSAAGALATPGRRAI